MNGFMARQAFRAKLRELGANHRRFVHRQLILHDCMNAGVSLDAFYGGMLGRNVSMRAFRKMQTLLFIERKPRGGIGVNIGVVFVHD